MPKIKDFVPLAEETGLIIPIGEEVLRMAFENAREDLGLLRRAGVKSIAINVSPRQFNDPDKFLIDRQDVAHQSFGGGSHFCLGNMLAKVEGRVAISRLAEKTKHLTIEPGETTWSESFFRVLGSYPITFK